ncbi:U3 small nucleolar RNA-associated protein 14 A [Nowakowskiella sp. JEL0078]|nr:U3 small nucleolar RNA-associated protein 14 A [Nowakowskiella sp. JEL0078]
MAMMQQLKRHEILTKRIQGKDSDESSDDQGDHEVPENNDEGEDIDFDPKTKALRQLDEVEDEIMNTKAETKGLMGMKFMQRDLERQKKAALDKLQKMRTKIKSGDSLLSDNEGSEISGGESNGEEHKSQKFESKKSQNTSDLMDETDEEESTDSEATPSNGTYSIQMSGRMSINTKSKLPTPESLFKIESFDPIESFTGKEFLGNVNKNKIDISIQAPILQEEKSSEQTKSKISISKIDPIVPVTETISEKTTKKSKKNAKVIPEEKPSNPWLDSEDTTVPTLKSLKSIGLSSSSGKTERALEKLQASRSKIRKTEADTSNSMDIDITGIRELENHVDSEHQINEKIAKIKPEDQSKPKNELRNKPKNESQSKPKIENSISLKTKSVKSEEMQIDTEEEPKNKKLKGKNNKTEELIDQSDGDSDFEASGDPTSMVHKSDLAKLSRRDVMQLAFASDNVVEEFEEEKARMVEDQVPSNEIVALPGWGSWAGSGIKPRENKRDKILKLERERKIEKVKSARSDSKLVHVVINEKRIRKVKDIFSVD